MKPIFDNIESLETIGVESDYTHASGFLLCYCGSMDTFRVYRRDLERHASGRNKELFSY